MPLDILEKPGTRFMIKIFTLKEMMMMTTMERTSVEIFYHKPRAGFSRISMGMITRLNEKKVNMISYSHLTLSLRRPLSVDWFLYDNGLRHERVKKKRLTDKFYEGDNGNQNVQEPENKKFKR